jgi:predicted NBD/HSP70 family sugar kinase
MRHEKVVRLLTAIYRYGAVSRDQLGREADVSLAAVSDLTNSLLSCGVLRISGERPSSGGRRAEVLELNGQSRFLISVDLQGNALGICLVDLDGHIHRCCGTRTEIPGLTFNRFLAELRGFLGDLPEREAALVVAVGVVTPELVDRYGATMISSNRIAWPGVPVRERLAHETGLPVYLARSGDAAIMGEKWFGAARAVDDSVVISLGRGVGCGLLLRGQLFSGSSLLAGEFGHTTVEPAGALCYCGKRGCLEMYVAEEGLLSRYAADARVKLAPGFGLRDLCSLARGGDGSALEVLGRAARCLGLRIADLLHVLNPEQIILAGALAENEDIFRPAVDNAIAEFSMPMLSSSTQIVTSALGPDPGPQGAAAYALHQLMRSPEGIDRLLTLHPL